MPKSLLGYRISEDGTSGPVEVSNDLKSILKSIQEVIDTDCIDITRRRMGPERRSYSIVCDDNGLTKGRKVTAVYGADGNALVGNLFILRHGDDGVLKSLTDDDIDYIKSCVRTVTRCFLDLVV